MKKPPLNFKLSELLLLVFELNLFVAGVVMIHAALTGSNTALYIPAQSLLAMLPALMTVGFGIWLVYRLRCLRQAKNRRAALAGAWCLGIVALSFGAAVGKLNTVHMSDTFQSAVAAAIHSPLLKQAGLSSLLAFMSIGFIFSLTFLLKAAKGPFATKDAAEQLQAQLGQLSQKIVQDWPESLVARIDEILNRGKVQDAITFYVASTGCTHDEASILIADWPEQRLMLQIELLNKSLAADADVTQRADVSAEKVTSPGTA